MATIIKIPISTRHMKHSKMFLYRKPKICANMLICQNLSKNTIEGAAGAKTNILI